jgi:hypothetical protein
VLGRASTTSPSTSTFSSLTAILPHRNRVRRDAV